MDFITDDLLITFTEGSTRQERFDLCSRHGFTPMREIAALDLWLAKVTEERELDDCIAAIESEPIVKSVRKNLTVVVPEIVPQEMALTDAYYGQQYHLQTLEVEAAWDMVPANIPQPIIIAHVDTGVKSTLPDFAGRIASGGWNSVYNTSNTEDIDSHGTATAGTIVANKNDGVTVGVNPRAMVRPFVGMGGSGVGTIFTICDAITRAGQSLPDIVSLSLGISYYLDELAAAIKVCTDNGAIVVASAGNARSIGWHYPSDHAGVLSVGSTSKDDGWGYVYSKSNYGQQVDIAAPGEMIYAPHPDGGARAYSGTSLAAPQGAGVASLVREKLGYQIPWQDMHMILRASCEKINIGTSTRIFFRSGRLNARLACENAGRYKTATSPELLITSPANGAVAVPGASFWLDYTVFGDSPIVQMTIHEGATLLKTETNPAKPYSSWFAPNGTYGEHTYTITVQDSQGRTDAKQLVLNLVDMTLIGDGFAAYWRFASAPSINPATGFLDFDLLSHGEDQSTIGDWRVSSIEQMGDAEYAKKIDTERMEASIRPFKTAPALPLENVNWCQSNELVESGAVTISGINVPVHCAVLGTGDVQLNGGSWAKGPLTVSVGDVLKVRNTSGAAQGAVTTTDLVVGHSKATFTLTTRNPAPPTGVTVTTSNGSLLVAWIKAAGATKYEVRYGDTADMLSSTGWLGDVDNCTISGLTAGVTYYLSVRAGNVDRVSNYTSTYTGSPSQWDADAVGWSTVTGVTVSQEQAYEGVTSFKFEGFTDTEAGTGLNATITHTNYSLDGKTKIAMRCKDLANPAAITLRVLYYNVNSIMMVVTNNVYFMDGQWHLTEFVLPSTQGTNKTVQISALNYDYDGQNTIYVDKIEAV